MNLYKIEYSANVENYITSIKHINMYELPDGNYKSPLHEFTMEMLSLILLNGYGTRQVKTGSSWFNTTYSTVAYIDLDYQYEGYQTCDEWLCIKREMSEHLRNERIDEILDGSRREDSMR